MVVGLFCRRGVFGGGLGSYGEVLYAAGLVVGDGVAVGVELVGEAGYGVVHLGVEDVALVEAVLPEAFLELCGGDVLALLGVCLEVGFLEVLAGYLGVETVAVGVVLVSPEDEAFGYLLAEAALLYAVTGGLDDAVMEVELDAGGHEVPGEVPLVKVPFVEEELAEVVLGFVVLVVVVGEGDDPLAVLEGGAVTLYGMVGGDVELGGGGEGEGYPVLALVVHGPVTGDVGEEELEVEGLQDIIDEDKAGLLGDVVPDEAVLQEVTLLAVDVGDGGDVAHELADEGLAASAVGLPNLTLSAVHGYHGPCDVGVLGIHGHVADGAELAEEMQDILVALLIGGLSGPASPGEVAGVLQETEEVRPLPRCGHLIGVGAVGGTAEGDEGAEVSCGDVTLPFYPDMMRDAGVAELLTPDSVTFQQLSLK